MKNNENVKKFLKYQVLNNCWCKFYRLRVDYVWNKPGFILNSQQHGLNLSRKILGEKICIEKLNDVILILKIFSMKNVGGKVSWRPFYIWQKLGAPVLTAHSAQQTFLKTILVWGCVWFLGLVEVLGSNEWMLIH